MNLAVGGDAGVDGHVAVDNVPACAPGGHTAIYHSCVRRFLSSVCVYVAHAHDPTSHRNRYAVPVQPAVLCCLRFCKGRQGTEGKQHRAAEQQAQ